MLSNREIVKLSNTYMRMKQTYCFFSTFAHRVLTAASARAKLLTAIALCLFSVGNVWGVDVLYHESFANSSSSSATASASTVTATQSMFYDKSATVWSHYANCSKISKNSTANQQKHTATYCSDKSQVSILFQATSTAESTILEVTGINISNATDLKLNFAFKFSGGTNYKAYAKIDNGSYVEIATATSGTAWQYVTNKAINGTGNQLSLKFTYQPKKSGNQFYLDEVCVTGTKSSLPPTFTIEGADDPDQPGFKYVDFGDVEVGKSKSIDVTIHTDNLTEDITWQWYTQSSYENLANGSAYTVTPAKISQTAKTTTFTITFNPKSAEMLNGLLYFTGSGLVNYEGQVHNGLQMTGNGIDCTPPTTPLTITPSATEVKIGNSITFTPNGGNGNTIKYTSNPKEGVTFNGNEATFNATDKFTITASQEVKDNVCGGEATAEVIVSPYTITYTDLVGYKVKNATDFDKITGTDIANNGKTIDIIPDDYYILPENIEIKMGSKTLVASDGVRTDFDYIWTIENGNGQIYLYTSDPNNGNCLITDNLTVTITATKECEPVEAGKELAFGNGNCTTEGNVVLNTLMTEGTGNGGTISYAISSGPAGYVANIDETGKFTATTIGEYTIKATQEKNEVDGTTLCGAETTFTITVTGAPKLEVDKTEIDFGYVILNTTQSGNFNVTPSYLANGYTVSPVASPYTLTPSKESYTTAQPFTVAFTPTASGEANQTINIAAVTETEKTATVSLKGKGVKLTYSVNMADGGSVTLSGNKITATVNPGYRYAATAYTVTPAAAASVSQSGDIFTVTLTEQCTGEDINVQINFEKIPTYTVTWWVNGKSTTEEVLENGKVASIPNVSDLDAIGMTDCADKFVGWSRSKIATPTDKKPDMINVENIAITKDKEFYAVFEKEEKEEGGSGSIVKMGKGDTFNDGDRIVVTAAGDYSTVAMYQETISSSYVNKFTVSQTGPTIDEINDDDKKWWSVSVSIGTDGKQNGWYLGDETNGYLNMSSNNLYCNETKSVWTLSDLDNGTFKLQSNSRNLSYRYDLRKNPYWRMGGANNGTSGQTILNIYKYISASTKYTYVTECSTCTPKVTVNDKTYNSYTLTWKSTGAENYVVKNNGTEYQTVNDAEEMSCTISGLTSNTEYAWSVSASEGCETTGTVTTTAKPCNVHWFVNGEELTDEATIVLTGSKVTELPKAPANDALGYCANAFMGWSTAELGSTLGQDRPGDLFTTDEDSPEFTDADEDTKFYAVFATGEGNGDAWIKMTEVPQVGDVVIFVQETELYELKEVTKVSSSTVGLATTYTNVPSGIFPLVVEQGIYNDKPNGLAFKSKSGGYLSYGTSSVTSPSNELHLYNLISPTDQKCQWDVSVSDGNFIISNKNTSGRNIRFNKNGGTNARFACYTSTQQQIQLYKQNSYTNYVTKCVPCTDNDLILQLNGKAEGVSIDMGENASVTVEYSVIGGNGTEIQYSITPESGVTKDEDSKTYTFTTSGDYTLTAEQGVYINPENPNEVVCGGEDSKTIKVTKNPYFEGATISSEEPIKVNCGEKSTIEGALTISFGKNYNLTKPITISVESKLESKLGFLLSTNHDADDKYTPNSITYTPHTTGNTIGQITEKVHVRAEAPVGATDNYKGVITISGEEIETRTIDVSAEVTCKEYKLTFKDKGTKIGQITQYPYTTIEQTNLPDDPATETCHGVEYVFDGWAEETISAIGETEYTKVDFDTYTMPKRNTTLHAVYRFTKEGEYTNDYERVGSQGELIPGANYVIAASYKDMDYALINTESTTKGNFASKKVTVNDENMIKGITDKSIIWKVEGNSDDGYTIYNQKTQKYLDIYLDGTKYILGLVDQAEYKFDIEITEEKNETTGKISTITTSRINSAYNYLSFYNNRFNAFNKDNGTYIYFFKNVLAPYYTTNPKCCEDVPERITYGSDTKSVTLSWKMDASTANVELYTDAACATDPIQTAEGVTSPCTFEGLDKATTYYAVIIAGGTCAADPVPVTTEQYQLDVVEWAKNEIVVTIDTDLSDGATFTTGETQLTATTNADGTITLTGLDLTKDNFCLPLPISITDAGNTIVKSGPKVPIIVDGQTTNNDFPNATVCATCDVVVRDKATMTQTAESAAQYRNMYLYVGSAVDIENGSLNVQKMYMYAHNDEVSYITNNGGTINIGELSHVKRIDEQYWYPFSLPYACAVEKIVALYGKELGKFGKDGDWGIKRYNGLNRQTDGNASGGKSYWEMLTNGDILNANEGYIVALLGSEQRERIINFVPVNKTAYDEKKTEKPTQIHNWNVNLTAEARHHGWNFTGSPYLSIFGKNDQLTMEGGVEQVIISVPNGAASKTYTQILASEKEIKPFTAYFVQAVDPTNGQNNMLDLTYSKGTTVTEQAAPRRATEKEAVIFVELNVTADNNKQLTDNAGLQVSDRFTDNYEIGFDLEKMYAAADRPQLYTVASDRGKLAYNALSDQSAQNIPLGLYVPQAGDYTLSLNRRASRLQAAESVYLLQNGIVVADLMLQDYTLSAAKGEQAGYSLDIRRATKVVTDVEQIGTDEPYAIVRDGQLTIGNLPEDAAVGIYDALGRLVWSVEQTDGRTPVVADLPQTGVYMVLIASGEQQYVLKSLNR